MPGGTFEEYVKAVEGLTIQEARRVIVDCLVADSVRGPNLDPLKTRSQARALAHAAVFVEEKRKLVAGVSN